HRHGIHNLWQHHRDAGAYKDAELAPRHQPTRFVVLTILLKVILIAHVFAPCRRRSRPFPEFRDTRRSQTRDEYTDSHPRSYRTCESAEFRVIRRGCDPTIASTITISPVLTSPSFHFLVRRACRVCGTQGAAAWIALEGAVGS